eukprot:scaffold16757_cov90-Isochrysis_galbana.AAC.1
MSTHMAEGLLFVRGVEFGVPRENQTPQGRPSSISGLTLVLSGVFMMGSGSGGRPSHGQGGGSL